MSKDKGVAPPKVPEVYPEAVPVTRTAPETLELAPAEPKVTAPVTARVVPPSNNAVKVGDVPLSQLTREQLQEHISKQFRQPKAHEQVPAPRPVRTARQQEIFEQETRRGASMVEHHASEAAKFKMPPRTEVDSGITKGQVIEPSIQPVGRTEEQKAYVPVRNHVQGPAEGQNSAQSLPRAGGTISGI